MSDSDVDMLLARVHAWQLYRKRYQTPEMHDLIALAYEYERLRAERDAALRVVAWLYDLAGEDVDVLDLAQHTLGLVQKTSKGIYAELTDDALLKIATVLDRQYPGDWDELDAVLESAADKARDSA